MERQGRQDGSDYIPEEYSEVLGGEPYGADSSYAWDTEEEKVSEEDWQEYEKACAEAEFAKHYVEEAERYEEYLRWCKEVGDAEAEEDPYQSTQHTNQQTTRGEPSSDNSQDVQQQ